MNYGMTNRVSPVFSEKMKNASTHHEIEYAEFIKSKIFVRSRRPRGRANHHHAMDENFYEQFSPWRTYLSLIMWNSID